MVLVWASIRVLKNLRLGNAVDRGVREWNRSGDGRVKVEEESAAENTMTNFRVLGEWVLSVCRFLLLSIIISSSD